MSEKVREFLEKNHALVNMGNGTTRVTNKDDPTPVCVLLCVCIVFVFTHSTLNAQGAPVTPPPQTQNAAQAQNTPPTQNSAPTENAAQAQNAPQNPNNAGTATIEGTVVSISRSTLVVRGDDNKFYLFTFNAYTVRQPLAASERVRVIAEAPDEDGTRVADQVVILQPAPSVTNNSAQVQAAPPPPQVTQLSSQIESEASRWHAGGRIGVGFDPELFLFGVQSQMGPFFSQSLILRPNVEFGFGELTDMFAINLEGAYRFKTTTRRGWSPYFGLGPSLNFIHRGASSGNVSFGNFNYKTGFNVFLGAQRHKTFLEMKTALWSGQAPTLSLFVGYNF